MGLKALAWLAFKKLPIILAVLVAPLTLFLVLNYNPSLLRIFRSPPPGPEPLTEEEQAARDAFLDPEQGLKDPTDGQRPALGDLGSANGQDWEPPDLIEPVWVEEAAAAANAEEFVRLGKTAKGWRRHELAESYYRKALELDPDNSAARTALGEITFDPAFHLDGFKALEGHQLESWLKPFRKRKGEWMFSDRLAELRAEWSGVRKALDLELERRKNDPYDERRRRHLRRLMREDFYATLINGGDFWTYRDHPPYLFFLEGEGSADQEVRIPLLVRLANDLDHARKTYQDVYLAAGATGSLEGSVFFIWILKTKDGDLFEAAYEPQDEMLVFRIPRDTRAGSLGEDRRRSAVRVFGRMLVDRHIPEEEGDEPEAWIRAGIPGLLAAGRGEKSAGRLRLNGGGLRGWPRFREWVGMNGGRWPIPLERLTAFLTLEELWGVCLSHELRRSDVGEKASPESLFQGAVEACALFCSYLQEEGDLDAFQEYVGERLFGRVPVGALDVLLGGLSFPAVEQAITDRYAGKN